MSKISGMKGDHSLCQQPEPFSLLTTRNCVTIKKINFHFGGLPPKFDPRAPCPPELKQSPSVGTRAWKNFRDSSNGCRENRVWKETDAPWRPNRKWAWSRDLMYRMRLMGAIIPENNKTLGLDLTTLFEFFDIAFGPTNGMSWKMSWKILLYTHARRAKTLLRSRTP